MPTVRYPNVPVPNTLRAQWLASLVEDRAFTCGGLLRRSVEDPETHEEIPAEVVHRPLTNAECCRRWYWRRKDARA